MKKGILVTSFGTTYSKTRKETIGAIENRIKEKFEDELVLRAFTSRIIISRIKDKESIVINNPKEALEIMKNKGIKDIYVQPLLIMEGKEFDRVNKEVDDFSKDNKDINIKIGKPLLTSEEDYEKAVDALDLGNFNPDKTLVIMGHGTSHSADITYKKLDKTIKNRGYDNVFLGTLEGEITLEDVIVELNNRNIDEVFLKPFMLVAGDHALNDMISTDEKSWKSKLIRNNFEVEISIKALGEVKAIQDIFIDHLKDIMD